MTIWQWWWQLTPTSRNKSFVSCGRSYVKLVASILLPSTQTGLLSSSSWRIPHTTMIILTVMITIYTSLSHHNVVSSEPMQVLGPVITIIINQAKVVGLSLDLKLSVKYFRVLFRDVQYNRRHSCLINPFHDYISVIRDGRISDPAIWIWLDFHYPAKSASSRIACYTTDQTAANYCINISQAICRFSLLIVWPMLNGQSVLESAELWCT